MHQHVCFIDSGWLRGSCLFLEIEIIRPLLVLVKEHFAWLSAGFFLPSYTQHIKLTINLVVLIESLTCPRGGIVMKNSFSVILRDHVGCNQACMIALNFEIFSVLKLFTIL